MNRTTLASSDILHKIQKGGRPEIFRKSEKGQLLDTLFAGDKPVANSYQWDAVFADGDMFKSGTNGQGIYVSPDKDLVIVWFSTVMTTDLTHYARLIAKTYSAGN